MQWPKEIEIQKDGWYAIKLPGRAWEHVELNKGQKIMIDEITIEKRVENAMIRGEDKPFKCDEFGEKN